MPLVLFDLSPEYKKLESEGVSVINTIRAENQDIRPLNIGIAHVGNLDTKILSFVSNTPLQINLSLIDLEKSSLSILSASFASIRKKGLDGLIIVGNYKESQKINELILWAEKHVTSTIFLGGKYETSSINKNIINHLTKNLDNDVLNKIKKGSVSINTEDNGIKIFIKGDLGTANSQVLFSNWINFVYQNTNYNPLKPLMNNLSKKDFLNNLKKGNQIILLIGPSGVGKSTTAKSLGKLTGYKTISTIETDEQIGKSKTMKDLLKGIPGKDEAEKMGNYFGKPWENPKRFKNKETHYLKIEKEEMDKVLKRIKSGEFYNCVIDLTGSAIYCPKELKKLKEYGITVYLKASHEHYEKMKETYLSDPKPICWNTLLDYWLSGATQKDLPKLYFKLLDERHKLYLRNADVVLPWEIHRGKIDENNPQTFINEVANILI